MTMPCVLRVENLSVLNQVHSVSFDIHARQRLGIIGESGSGKTLTALAIMRLIDAQGSIIFDGKELLTTEEKQLCAIRGNRIAMIFQEPMTALNPLMSVGKQIVEAVRIHAGRTMSRRTAKRIALELLSDVELGAELFGRYPHQLSGGQRQRIIIAMALAHRPQLLICDEPTTALDVTSQAAIMQLIDSLVDKYDMSLLFITHDLGLVAQVCEQVLVMKDGQIVERGDTHTVLHDPQHSYTRMLVSASILDPAPAHQPSKQVLIELRDVAKKYKHTVAVEQVDLTVHGGERLGIVGGSGSGKTTTLKMIAGLEKPSSGAVHIHADFQMIFQDPFGSLDPRMRIEHIINETLPTPDRDRVAEVLRDVGLKPEHMHRFPHEFSGGQRQRISIARALAPRPRIVLADEPVSALDICVRKKILDLLNELVTEHNLTLVFVSHDITAVQALCNDLVVMHQGRIVEQGAVADVLANPQHSYTQALIDAVPRLHRRTRS
ncbi:ABC transporter ATP-binding protein [Corynebacterium sp. sy017]|uniref:ATP-binding cassette domain-containing protein n=2 Tax=unclassified Corynebacterium TaxID=2624378 RepID=UPI0011853F7C|nr:MULTISPECIES: ABC transporter ATP-binding protein [unclassified Corynebacterium]MBP3088088.1 ABC transporter ATP-binding protein [Corynebacterium sp. sy017]TSD92761.1 ABC transporter ATP-binding protein [Corynebacterium sp. SY003]